MHALTDYVPVSRMLFNSRGKISTCFTWLWCTLTHLRAQSSSTMRRGELDCRRLYYRNRNDYRTIQFNKYEDGKFFLWMEKLFQKCALLCCSRIMIYELLTKWFALVKIWSLTENKIWSAFNHFTVRRWRVILIIFLINNNYYNFIASNEKKKRERERETSSALNQIFIYW